MRNSIIPTESKALSTLKSSSGNTTSCSSSAISLIKNQAGVPPLLAAPPVAGLASIAKLYILQLSGSAWSPYAARGRGSVVLHRHSIHAVCKLRKQEELAASHNHIKPDMQNKEKARSGFQRESAPGYCDWVKVYSVPSAAARSSASALCH